MRRKGPHCTNSCHFVVVRKENICPSQKQAGIQDALSKVLDVVIVRCAFRLILAVAQIVLMLDGGNGTLQRAGQVDVEERSVQAVHDSDSLLRRARVRFAVCDFSRQVIRGWRAVAARPGHARVGSFVLVPAMFDDGVGLDHAIAAARPGVGAGSTGKVSVFLVGRRVHARQATVTLRLGGRGGAGGPADLGHAEDGFPAVVFLARWRRGVSEPGGRQGPFRPAVGDACKVPLHRLGRRVAVELVADVDEVLHAGHVDIVDGRHVENDGLERREVRAVFFGLAAAGTGVVPGSVAGAGPGVWVRAARVLEDVSDEVVRVVVGVGVVETFREAVHEDTRVRRLDVDRRVRAVVVVEREEDISDCTVVVGHALVVMELVFDQVVANDGVDFDFANEVAVGFDDTEQKDGGADGDGRVNAVFDG